MKKTIAAICIFALIIFIPACSRHVSPAAVTEPDIAADINTPVLTAAATAVSTQTPAVVPTGSITATSTLGTVTVVSTNTPVNTFTHTYTNTSVSTATFTAVATSTSTGTNYRVKKYTAIVNDGFLGLIRADYSFIYGNGGGIQTEITAVSYDNGVLDSTADFVFDAGGNTISGIVNDSSGALKRSVTGIVVSDMLAELRYYDAGGILESREVYQTDSQGRKTRIDYYDETGVIIQYELYQYNAAGQTTRFANYQGGIQRGATEYFYNAAGKLARNDSYMGSALSGYTVYYFNASGFNSSANFYDGAGGLIGSGIYTCDSRGNVLSLNNSINSGGFTTTHEFTAVYNAADLPTYIKAIDTSVMMGITSTTTMETIIEYETY